MGADAQCWICEGWRFSITLVNKHLIEIGKKEVELGHVTPQIQLKPFEDALRPSDLKEGAPHYYSDSTYWQPVKMEPIHDFCKKIDYNKPDFLQILKDMDKCRNQITDTV